MKKRPNDENVSLYEQIFEGLSEGIAHARGELTLKTTTLPGPAPTLSKARVVAIRKKVGMSQASSRATSTCPRRPFKAGNRAPARQRPARLDCSRCLRRLLNNSLQSWGRPTMPARVARVEQSAQP